MQTMAASTLTLVAKLVEDLLNETGVMEPPVDAKQVATRLGLEVVLNRSQKERGRLIESAGMTTIVVRPEPRRERYQWTIAHEIGEYVIPRLADEWSSELIPLDAAVREWLSNQFATYLLTPSHWFLRDAAEYDFDLLALKERYATASYEVIAFRMLDAQTPCIMTIFDNGRVSRRLGNLCQRPPAILEVEQLCRQEALRKRQAITRKSDLARVQAWLLHEDDWQREILRTELFVWDE